MKLNIAIDGPSGAGKSTVAKMLAKKLNCIYVDTGAMYRATALFFMRKNIIAEDIEAIKSQLTNVDIKLEIKEGSQIIKLNGEDVTTTIRTQEIGEGASQFAVVGEIREYLVTMQKEIGKNNDVVMDGRDIGSTVLKEAPYKFYLDASSVVRAKRRIGELEAMGIEVDLDNIKFEIEERDRRDKGREISPLVMAKDAIYIDSSHKSIDEVINIMINTIKK